MANPTPKSAVIELLLNNIADRTASITQNRCIKKPYGCGGPATEFTDALSTREYAISGLCQKCQDEAYNHPEDDDQQI